MNTAEIALNVLELSRHLGSQSAQELACAVIESMNRAGFHVVVIGEFNRGKSTFVNALLQTDILPVDAIPSTAAVHVVEYGGQDAAEVVWLDGKREALHFSSQSLDAFTAQGDVEASQVHHLHIRLQNQLLNDGVVLIDTPGVNDIMKTRAEITAKILPHCDAAIFLLDAATPVTSSEANFLETKVLHNKLDKILFVLSKTDRLDEDELPEAIAGANERLRSLGITTEVFPFSSKEVLQSHKRNQMSGQWTELWARVNQLQRGSEASKHERNVMRLSLALDVLADHVAVQETLLAASEEQLHRLQLQIQDAKEDYRLRFEQLLASIETVGAATLRKMFIQSAARFQEQLVQDITDEVRLTQGNFERLAEQVIPIRLERSIRQFSESKQVEISTYLARFSEHVANEYQAHFGQPLQGLFETSFIQLPSWRASVDQASTKVINRVLMHALPTAVGAAVGLVLVPVPGVGAVLGGAAGNVMAQLVMRGNDDDIQAKLLEEIPSRTEQVVQMYLIEALGQIDSWFADLRSALVHYHQSREAQLIAEVEMRVSNLQCPAPGELQSEKDELSNSQRRLAHLRVEVERLLG